MLLLLPTAPHDAARLCRAMHARPQPPRRQEQASAGAPAVIDELLLLLLHPRGRGARRAPVLPAGHRAGLALGRVGLPVAGSVPQGLLVLGALHRTSFAAIRSYS